VSSDSEQWMAVYLRYYIFETQISKPSGQILWTHQKLPKVGKN